MDFSIGHLWASMGLFAKGIVIVLLFMSAASVTVMIERIIVYAMQRGHSTTFAMKMGGVLSKGDLAAAAGTDFGKQVGYLGRVIGAGMTAYKTAPKDRDAAVESVARALERQAAREVAVLKRGLGILATVGSTAPFVGLLGTVMGIVNSFQLMAASGSGGLATVSAGIAEALVTTAIGLLAAIPAVMAFNFLQGWVDNRSVDISESSNEFLDYVSKNLAQG